MGFESRRESFVSLSAEKPTPKTECSDSGIWSSILSEVVSAESSRLPSNKQLVLLGDSLTGKTTLVAKLQGNEDPKKGAGLECAHILVKDEYRDVTTRLSVWTLDGDPAHAHLLKFALRANQLPDTVVVLAVSMTTPWDIMDQLHSWATVIQDHIDQLDISTDVVRQQQAYVQQRWQQYLEPGDELESSVGVSGAPSASTMAKSVSSADEVADQVLLPLGENVLTRNLGLDVVVVVTKTDYMATLEKDHDYKDEHFDFIQQYVRKFCLQYGAALFYTSVKEDKNCDLLYKYLTHRIYGFPFKTPALVVEKDAVFIPAGWDNDKKISILHEGMHSLHPEAYYTDIIARPIVRKTVVKDVDEQCEDEQVFLARLQQKIIAGGAAVGGGAAGLAAVVGGSSGSLSSTALGKHDAMSRTTLSSSAKTPERRVGSSPVLGASLSTGKKLDAGKAGAGVASEGVLANFFNSLLNKKSGSPPVGGAGGGSGAASPVLKTSGASVAAGRPDVPAISRTDAAAELERLSRTKDSSGTTSTGDSGAQCSSDC